MTSESADAARAPTPEEVRAVVEHMLASDVFSGSPQLAAFLRFVVSATLRGESQRIKAYTIGVEVMRRDTSFDPQLDPIVRVEATRLRRTLERYYAGPGAGDRVIIDLPIGSYVPRFRYAEAAAIPPVGPLGRNRNRMAAAALMAAIAVGAIILVSRDETPTVAGTPRAGNGMPVLSVGNIGMRGTPGVDAIAAPSFQDKLYNALSRFDTIDVISAGSDAAALAASRDGIVDYRLAGTIHYDSQRSAKVLFELFDADDAKVVWSGDFTVRNGLAERTADEETIIFDVATKLLQPWGVIRAYERARHLAGNAGDPRYRCIVEASESFRSFDPASHGLARACLERLTATHQDFGSGFTYLAAIYFREYLYGFGVRDGDPPALDRALRAARRGIELMPESARAYQILFAVLFTRREFPSAFAAGERALALNPYDMTIVADYGRRLVLTGEIERGMEFLRRAERGSVVRPSLYHFYAFLGHYLLGHTTDAGFHANQITVEHYPLGYVARALAAAAAGDHVQAGQQLDQLFALMPVWRTDTRGQIGKFVPDQMIADRLARDIDAARPAVTLAPQAR